MKTLFLVSFFILGFESILLNSIYIIAFGLAGIAVFRSGWQDVIQADNSVGFHQDLHHVSYDQFPERMYIGHQPSSIFHAYLYDMDGREYSEISQSTHFDIKFFRPFIYFFSGGNIFPAAYDMTDEEGLLSYRLIKKGGFTWRGYVQHPDGPYLAYTIQTKQSGRSKFRYIEGDQCRWEAEGDAFIGHFTVTDEKGHIWAVIKRDAIPAEAADRFDRMPGYLIEWKERRDIPQSLIAFLFLIQTHTSI
ncbi:hypothetical protein [Halobacillus andaensis]|uniref:hypothetical protein n=1 Tax=Halobacillus andaensis TaxID=1176239 RepID=UPI003D741132